MNCRCGEYYENVAKYITKVLNSFHKNVKRKTLFFFSTAVSMVLSAGRETRSTDETPLKDETTNTPTAFNDRLVGSDDLDTFTALAGDDEIYGIWRQRPNHCWNWQ